MVDPNIGDLAAALRARRREKRMSLRELADATGVSLNTLSRVERGHVPDLKTFQRIIEWLDLPAENFLDRHAAAKTPEVIARHLRADRQLSPEAATKIAELVEEMYHQLVGQRPEVSLHLRAARTFTPAAGALLADILSEMRTALEAADT